MSINSIRIRVGFVRLKARSGAHAVTGTRPGKSIRTTLDVPESKLIRGRAAVSTETFDLSLSPRRFSSMTHSAITYFKPLSIPGGPLTMLGMPGMVQTKIPRHCPTLGFETHPEEPLLVEDKHASGDESEIGGTAIHGDLADQDPGGVPAGLGRAGSLACRSLYR